MGVRPALERFDRGGAPVAAESAPAPVAAPEPEAPPPPDPAEILARIEARLAGMGAEAAALIAAERTRLTTAFQRAAEAALPALAKTGFAAELAAAVDAVAAAGPEGEIVLRLGPDDLEAAAPLLADARAIRPAPDPALGPGEARLAWRDGGADLDMAAMTERALAALHRHLPTPPQRPSQEPPDQEAHR